MKKSKILFSMISIILSVALMFSVFSSGIFNNEAAADVKLYNVNKKITEFKEDIFNIFYDEKDGCNKTSDVQKPLPKVYLGGYPIGLKLYADGVVVVGTESVDTQKGPVNTAEKAGLKTGDVIKKVNGIRVHNNSQVSQFIEKSAGDELLFDVERDGEIIQLNFKAEFSEIEQKYKAGIWIRDSSAGIGTVTFCTQDGGFACLGHAVCDIDTKATIPISQGECTDVKITGFIKGANGSAGELCGYLENESTGVIFSNDDIGVYGLFESLPEDGSLYEIARISEIETGEAQIVTCVENGLKAEYSIVIEKIDKHSNDNKNLVIKITDRRLIEKTGGIIQGMSGSPIIQNGKIIGAVTHVFLNDATGGFGIFAETMIKKLDLVKNLQ